MKVGDTVRLIGLPDGLEDYPDGAELLIGSVTGNPAEKIYVGPELRERISK